MADWVATELLWIMVFRLLSDFFLRWSNQKGVESNKATVTNKKF